MLAELNGRQRLLAPCCEGRNISFEEIQSLFLVLKNLPCKNPGDLPSFGVRNIIYSVNDLTRCGY